MTEKTKHHDECCDKHHHHHHNGVCCEENHHHHHVEGEQCKQDTDHQGKCCTEHHHHHHNGECCEKDHHHHHLAGETCQQDEKHQGKCCTEHHHHHHNGECCEEDHHHHHLDGETCQQDEKHQGECCTEHHHHHHNGECCEKDHLHHHLAGETCQQDEKHQGECCTEHHHHHHNGECCEEDHHHHHLAGETCYQDAKHQGECCDKHHHHHHHGLCCDEDHHHHHLEGEVCSHQEHLADCHHGSHHDMEAKKEGCGCGCGHHDHSHAHENVHQHDHNHECGCGCGHDHDMGYSMTSINHMIQGVKGKEGLTDLVAMDLKNLANALADFKLNFEETSTTLGLVFGLALTSDEEQLEQCLNIFITRDDLAKNKDFIEVLYKLISYVQQHAYDEFFFLNDFFAYFLNPEKYNTVSGAQWYAWFLTGYSAGAAFGLTEAKKLLDDSDITKQQMLLRAEEELNDVFIFSSMMSTVGDHLDYFTSFNKRAKTYFDHLEFEQGINYLEVFLQSELDKANKVNDESKEEKVQVFQGMQQRLKYLDNANVEAFFEILKDFKRAVDAFKEGKQIQDPERPDLTIALLLVVPDAGDISFLDDNE